MLAGMPISFRRATLDDLDIVQGHRDRMFLDMGTDPEHVAAGRPAGRAWLARALPEGRYVGVLAEGDAAVVGGVGVVWIDLPPNMHTTVARRGYVLNMFVEPDARRRGLARRLLEEALAVCREAGVDYVTLHASEAGRGLYESRGFSANHEMRLLLRTD